MTSLVDSNGVDCYDHISPSEGEEFYNKPNGDFDFSLGSGSGLGSLNYNGLGSGSRNLSKGLSVKI